MSSPTAPRRRDRGATSAPRCGLRRRHRAGAEHGVGDQGRRPPRVRAGADGEDGRARGAPGDGDRFDVLGVRPAGDLLDVDVAVECSSGTYVRALARDLGAALGVGGHLTALRRTRSGRSRWTARTLDELAELEDPVDAAAGRGGAYGHADPRRRRRRGPRAVLRRALDAAGLGRLHGAVAAGRHGRRAAARERRRGASRAGLRRRRGRTLAMDDGLDAARALLPDVRLEPVDRLARQRPLGRAAGAAHLPGRRPGARADREAFRQRRRGVGARDGRAVRPAGRRARPRLVAGGRRAAGRGHRPTSAPGRAWPTHCSATTPARRPSRWAGGPRRWPGCTARTRGLARPRSAPRWRTARRAAGRRVDGVGAELDGHRPRARRPLRHARASRCRARRIRRAPRARHRLDGHGAGGAHAGRRLPGQQRAGRRRVVLVDFEGAEWRHVAWDVAYLRVPWPTCWCSWRMPDAVAEPPSTGTARLAAAAAGASRDARVRARHRRGRARLGARFDRTVPRQRARPSARRRRGGQSHADAAAR